MTRLRRGEDGVYDVLEDARKAPSTVRVLDLYWEWRDNALAAIPDDLDRFTNLEALLVDSLRRPSFANGMLKRLPRLTTIVLAHADLETIPDAIFDVATLEELRVTENRIAVLPDAFDRLPALVSLDLSQNRIASLPSSLARAARLEELVLESNALTSLPAWIAELPALRHLDVGDNPLPASDIARVSRWVEPTGYPRG